MWIVIITLSLVTTPQTIIVFIKVCFLIVNIVVHIADKLGLVLPRMKHTC